MSKDTPDAGNCPAKYLPLQRFVMSLIESNTSAFRTPIRREVRRRYPDVWSRISLKGSSNGGYSIEKLFKLIGLPVTGICPTCSGVTIMNNRSSLKPRTYCSTACISRDPSIKERKVTKSIETYGCEHYFLTKEFREKSRKSYFNKTGYNHQSQNPDVLKKKSDNYERRTGYRNPSQNPEVVSVKRQRYKLKTGYEEPFQNPVVRNLAETTLERQTGYRNPLQNPDTREKMGDRREARTGYRHQWGDPVSRAKVEDAREKRTGYRNPLQNPEVFEKKKKSGYLLKEFISKSGEIHLCQGHEPIVLEYLDSNENVKEYTTVSGTELVPTITYTKPNGKRGTYYPDIGVLLKDGTSFLIEVKSEYYLWKDELLNRAKFKAATRFAKNKGNCVFWLVKVLADGTLHWQFS